MKAFIDIGFHEINPACAKWAWPGTTLTAAREFSDIIAGGDRSILSIDWTSPLRDRLLTRLTSLPKVKVMGDVSPYHLPNVEIVAANYADARFPVIRRGKSETVRSYTKKMRDIEWRPWPLKNVVSYRNHWVEHDGSVWEIDPVWDKCFPNFQADTLEDALGQYWDHYYETAEKLAAELPSQVRIFDIDDLNTEEGQRRILTFCGFSEISHVEVHTNKGHAT